MSSVLETPAFAAARSASESAAARARVQAIPLDQLNPVDVQGFVDDTVGFTLERLRREFIVYLWLTCRVTWDEFIVMPADVVDRTLAAYGQAWFGAGRYLWSYVELINGMVACRRDLRGVVPHAWDAAWTWKSLIPHSHRNAMPEQVFLAMLSIAIVWGMDHLALLLGAGFLGLLRAHEVRNVWRLLHACAFAQHGPGVVCHHPRTQDASDHS